MKKKEFHSKLNLGKSKISNLQQNNLQGGTDGIIQTVTYVIVRTVKITIDIYTTPEVCDEGSTRCTTIPPSCVETACICPPN